MSKTRHIVDDEVMRPPVGDTVTAHERHPGGHRIARHFHDRHQLVYPSTGLVEVSTAAGSWVAPSDRAIWIPAFAWHEHRFYGPTEFHCVGIDARTRPLAGDQPCVVTVTPLLRELVIECSQGEESGERSQPHVGRLHGVLVDQLRRSDDAALALPTPTDDRLSGACALVAADLSHVYSLSGLGREVGASERTLSRLFRAELGLTYPQWRAQVRLRAALIALAEGATVTDVALKCGWATPSAFVDAYRRAFGHTPGSRHRRTPTR